MYVAPEVLDGEAYDGYKSDMWAVGVLIYLVVGWRMPFEHSLEGLHCNARGALIRVQNVRLAKRPCAPAEGILRTSAGHRVGARARSARGMPRGAAGGAAGVLAVRVGREHKCNRRVSAENAQVQHIRGGLYQVTRISAGLSA